MACTTPTFLECGCDQFIIETCSQGPVGPSGGATQLNPDPINPTDTDVVDSLPVADFMAAKWIIHMVTDEGTPRYRALEVLGMYNGTTSFYNVTGAVGEAISAVVVVDLNGTNLELQVTNNEAVDITARILRLAVELSP